MAKKATKVGKRGFFGQIAFIEAADMLMGKTFGLESSREHCNFDGAKFALLCLRLW